jgi:hypothetical protein
LERGEDPRAVEDEDAGEVRGDNPLELAVSFGLSLR